MNLKEEFELLRQVPTFAVIKPAKLKLLAFMSERVGFDPGAQLMRRGDPADAAYDVALSDSEATMISRGAVMAARPAQTACSVSCSSG